MAWRFFAEAWNDGTGAVGKTRRIVLLRNRRHFVFSKKGEFYCPDKSYEFLQRVILKEPCLRGD